MERICFITDHDDRITFSSSLIYNVLKHLRKKDPLIFKRYYFNRECTSSYFREIYCQQFAHCYFPCLTLVPLYFQSTSRISSEIIKYRYHQVIGCSSSSHYFSSDQKPRDVTSLPFSASISLLKSGASLGQPSPISKSMSWKSASSTRNTSPLLTGTKSLRPWA